MLVSDSNIIRVEIFDFRSLLGSHTYEPADFHVHQDIHLAIEWCLGKRLNRKKIFTESCTYSSVRLTIHNPKLFFDDKETVRVERRMFSPYKGSEFLIHNRHTSLGVIKETLSTPYCKDIMDKLNHFAELYSLGR